MSLIAPARPGSATPAKAGPAGHEDAGGFATALARVGANRDAPEQIGKQGRSPHPNPDDAVSGEDWAAHPHRQRHPARRSEADEEREHRGSGETASQAVPVAWQRPCDAPSVAACAPLPVAQGPAHGAPPSVTPLAIGQHGATPAQPAAERTATASAASPVTSAAGTPRELRVTNTSAGALVAEIIVRREPDGGLRIGIEPGFTAATPRLRANLSRLKRDLAQITCGEVSVRVLGAVDPDEMTK